MTVNGWLSAGWTDFRLSWDPVNYDGLNTIRVPASSVWIPDLSVYNSWNCDADQSKLDTVNYQVVISSSGYIIFVPALKMTVDCADGDTWTYTDSSNSCLIKIGTWTYDANNIALTTFPGKDQKMDLAYLSYNSPVIVKTQEEESIKTKRYDCCLEPYMEVAYRCFARIFFQSSQHTLCPGSQLRKQQMRMKRRKSSKLTKINLLYLHHFLFSIYFLSITIYKCKSTKHFSMIVNDLNVC